MTNCYFSLFNIRKLKSLDFKKQLKVNNKLITLKEIISCAQTESMLLITNNKHRCKWWKNKTFGCLSTCRWAAGCVTACRWAGRSSSPASRPPPPVCPASECWGSGCGSRCRWNPVVGQKDADQSYPHPHVVTFIWFLESSPKKTPTTAVLF